MISKKVLISNALGLHARAAASLVKTSNRFISEITIKRNETTVNGKSIMGVLMLAASKGTEIEIIVDGEDESEAVEAIISLINNKFGESE
jgi:phosphocarrier protein HPr